MVIKLKFTGAIFDPVDSGKSETFSKLILKYFCEENCEPKLHQEEQELIGEWIKNAQISNAITFSQLNELLLLLNQDTMKREFFRFFFGKDKISWKELIEGILNFCGFAMLCFGNIKYAYKMLSRLTESEIREEIKPYSAIEKELINSLENRSPITLKIDTIPKDKTWLVGESAANQINKISDWLKEEFEKAKKGKSEFKLEKIRAYAEKFFPIEENLKEIQEITRKNTDIYLSWDYMDVYVATSMRAEWEFEETFDFIQNLFKNSELVGLNLRYFDPTQSKCGNRIDKGLIEGLMLRRASCTIYMVQENDTLGKDSELAATLAQKKPVIAYVPDYDSNAYSEKISAYPIDFFRKRILILKAEGIFDQTSCAKEILKHFTDYKEVISHFLTIIDKLYEKKPFVFPSEAEKLFYNDEGFPHLCTIIAIAECFRFERRAKMLREIHPLAMQVDLNSGVSNGVLVVRNHNQCAELLRRILTNNIEFIIKHEEYEDESRKSKEGYITLVEKISAAPFRVVTDQQKLTNSFWNQFFRR